MSSPKFAETHNVVAFLENTVESDGFAEIIDYLKASFVHYALTVNPIIYTSCIEQVWATAKVQTVNGVHQLQALVNKKRVIVMESSIRRDLHLDDAEGTNCLQTATIFEELARIGAKSTAWNEFSSSIASLIICLATNQKFNLSNYIFDAMVKHLDGGIKFLMYPRFLQVFINQQLDHPTDSTQIPIIYQSSSSSQPKKKQPSKKAQRQEAEVPKDETEHEESVPTPSNDPQLSAKEISALKKRIQRLERKKMSRPTGLKRLKKVEKRDDELVFDSRVLDADEMPVEAKVDGKDEQSTKPNDSTTGEAVTTASVEGSAAPTTIEEITLAQTLIQIKAAKPKVVTTAATTTTTTRPKARGVVVQEPSEFKAPQEVQPSISKDKGKEQKLARKQEEEANIALIESWENTQAMMEVDRFLAERLQSREREELTDEEKGKLFMKLMEKRRKHFAALRAQEKRNIPPTKAQKRTKMSTYLMHMEKKVEGSEETTKGGRKKMLGRKRVGKEQQQESSKKQRVEEEKESDEVEEVEKDDEAELKKHLVIKKDEDKAINAIPLLLNHLMLQGIDREDLEALWKIVKTKYSDKRPEDEFERVLWGDLKVMFEPDKRSDVWRILQGYKVTIWKLIDSSGVHFVRRNLKIQKMNIKFRGGLLGLKRLHGFLEVTTAQRLVISLFVQDYCFIHNTSRFGINKWYQSFALRNFDLEDMEFESTNSGTTAKLPILKLGEYEMWVIRIKQYFQIQDYALWEVIENGDSWVSVP
ncbi:hypothetical protein Tco_1292765 [Tanacetum coccineum]